MFDLTRLLPDDFATDDEVLRAIRSVPPHFSGLLSILKDCLVTRVGNAAVAAQTEILSSVLNNTDFDSVLFLVALNTVVDTAIMTLTAKSNPTNSSAGGTLEKAGTPITGATSSNKTMALEVHKPSQQFVFLSFTRTVANVTVDAIYAIQFNAHKMPQTHGLLAGDISGPLT
jgi:hypothetical protein